MSYCPNCGTELPEGAAFCPNCGHQVGAAQPGFAGGPPPPVEYPARLDVDYPDRPLSRASTFFRMFMLIPIGIVYALVVGVSFSTGQQGAESGAVGGGILWAPLILMLLFRKRYPGWWFEWNLALTRFGTRIAAYASLMDDRYPSTEDEQSVHLDLDPPDAAQLSRGLPLVKWLLAIPHYIVLLALGIGAFFVIVIAWFAILFTGRYPRWAFDYVLGVLRWSLRVQAYAFLLITDRYPPFSLS
ncbi:MAG TPA: DUF4389 domain-containing protein [Gaiellales bacterium]|nr:DUF4389 domain-containing protein [Gaiellales bacterium]